MAEQFSLFGDPLLKPAPRVARAKDESESSYSLFFSLFPTPQEAAEVAGRAASLLMAQGLRGRPLLPHRLHVTCHDLGNYVQVPQDLIDAAIRAGDALSFDAFDVVFDSALSYPSAGTYVLSGREGTRQLTAFREALGETMRAEGLRVNRSFTPHMTLVYDCQVVAEHVIEPVRWRASEFVLIRSHVRQGRYDTLGCWPLTA